MREIKSLQEEVKDAIDEGRELLCIDEAIYNPKAGMRRHWSPQGQPMKWESRWSNHAPYYSACAATSITKGMVHWEIYKSMGCTGETTVAFLKRLKQHYPGKHDKIAILADNNGIHNMDMVWDYCDKVDIKWILNVKYRPDFNGIEGVWGWTKQVYRKRLDWYRANGIIWK